MDDAAFELLGMSDAAGRTQLDGEIRTPEEAKALVREFQRQARE